MAQFDYFRMADKNGFWLDCQTDLMDDYATRFVIPLVPSDAAPQRRATQLNPQFIIGRRTYDLLTQFAGTIPADDLDQPIGSLEHERYTIVKALDCLITGV